MANGNGLAPGLEAGFDPKMIVTMDPGIPNNPLAPPASGSTGGAATAPASAAGQTDTAAPTLFNTEDRTRQLGFGNKFGGYRTPNGMPQGMIIHHTGAGDASVDQLINAFKASNLASNFAIGRDGTIYQLLPDGSTGQHIKPGEGQYRNMNNHNMEGVEVIANDDKDVLPVQAQAAAQLVAQRSKQWGWVNPQQVVYGHGEVNPSTKQATEGMTITNGIRSGALPLPYQQPSGTPATMASMTVPMSGATQSPSPEVGVSSYPAGTNQLAPQGAGAIPPKGGVNVPQNIAPFLNYAADYYGLDRNIFAQMIQHESSFVPDKQGASGEVGLGQIMPKTAEDLGVKDRTDPYQNLMGAAKYLRKWLDDPRVQGDYRKALMLYNLPAGNFQNTAYADAVLNTKGSPTGGIGVTGTGSGSGYPGGEAADFRTPTNPLAAPAPTATPDAVASASKSNISAIQQDARNRMQAMFRYMMLSQALKQQQPVKPPRAELASLKPTEQPEVPRYSRHLGSYSGGQGAGV